MHSTPFLLASSMLYYFLPENQFQMIKSHVVRFTIAAGLLLSTIFYISHFFH